MRHNDGYIVQSTGDGIFALFGAPAAHEDHPQRTLYAALRIQKDLKPYSDSLQVEGKLPLQALGEGVLVDAQGTLLTERASHFAALT